MKVRKIIARNMSEGLKAVSAELGDEAMILSNRKVAEGVEILAAVKPEDSTAMPDPQANANRLPGSSAMARDRQSAEPPATASAPAAGGRGEGESMEDSIIRLSQQDDGGLSRESLMSLLDAHKDPLEQKRQKLRAQLSAQGSNASRDRSQAPQAEPRTPREQPAPTHAPRAAEPAPRDNRELTEMREELASLREWLETRDNRGADDGKDLHPVAIQLNSLGFDPRCVTPLVEKIRRQPMPDAWTLGVEKLSGVVEKHASCLVRKGGVAALVGPTGAGKTTTLSKIATRFAMQHGADDLGIISLDQYRIGAHEPVRILGRILGCDVILSDTQDELEQQLAKLSNKKLILIDTNGSDRGLQAFREQLGGSVLESQIQPLLVLPANLSKSSVDSAWRRFGVLNPRGLVLTKADESPEIGPVLSLSLLKKVPLVYWSDGTLVPQDLHFGQVSNLISLCHGDLQYSESGEKFARIG